MRITCLVRNRWRIVYDRYRYWGNDELCLFFLSCAVRITAFPYYKIDGNDCNKCTNNDCRPNPSVRMCLFPILKKIRFPFLGRLETVFNIHPGRLAQTVGKWLRIGIQLAFQRQIHQTRNQCSHVRNIVQAGNKTEMP